MKNVIKSLQRPLYAIAAIALLFGLTATSVLPGFASAYGQITSRSVKISSSAQSASSTEYTIAFTETAATVVKGITVDFCAESPLYADTCTLPTGFTAASAALSTQTGTSGWTLTGAASGHFQISGATANSAAAMSFVVTGITNPSTLGTFYARIYAYANAPDYTNVTTPGTVRDFGGIALTTTQSVNITARVMEQLTLCVSGTAFTGNNCAGSAAPTLIIGHGSTVKALDSSATDTANAYTQVASNATSGVTVRMKNSNACGGLSRDGGTTCNIAATGTPAVAIAAGNALFGLKIGASTTETGGSGSLTPAAPYNDATNYGMDITTANDNVTTTYGDTILSTASPLNGVDNTLTFGASAATTTPAGVYTAAMNLIATGTF